MPVPYNRIAGGDVGRIAALSDGVFAFAATVLVLDFHAPETADVHSEADLLAALWASAPRLLPWLLSLLTLGIFWLVQADAVEPARPLEPRSRLAPLPRCRSRLVSSPIS